MKIVTLFPADSHPVFWTDANVARVLRIGELVAYPIEGFDPAEFVREHADAEIIITSWSSPQISAEIIAGLPRLRILGHAAGSVRWIFDGAAWDKGITVLSGVDTIGRFVGEMTITLALCGLRRIVQVNDVTREDGWRESESRGQTLFDAPVGLAGFGYTARHAARLFRAFTPNIRAYDPFVDDAGMQGEGVSRATLEELFASSRLLSLHLPSLPETKHMIGMELLSTLPRGAVLVNTARGSVLKHDDLEAFLRERADATALLDVTDPEPLPAGHPLRTLPNVVLTPHTSGAPDDSWPLILSNLLKDMETVLAGGTPVAAIAPDFRHHMA